ncbi:hypothetical protein, partial [Helicobacter sp. 12S02232-10]|uniref:hypothetical protein n=1 Tax=Helicobacter sp. 12S02232-10 TaxID=1476197 RepID=UPI0015DE26B0
DNLFSSLYQAIIKGNPKLKMEARNIAREMLKEMDGKCRLEDDDDKLDRIINRSHSCIYETYDNYILKLASFLYQNDQVLFNQIFKDTQKSPTPYYSEFFKYYLVYPKISGKETRDLENEKENQAKEINDAFRQQFSTAS